MELHLGKLLDQKTKEVLGDFELPAQDLATHMFICGVTGSGKTVLGKAIIEEAALQGIPSIVIDLKGDLSSLGLAFPSADPRDFAPWVEVDRDADREELAAKAAREYQSNLQRFGISLKRVTHYTESTQTVIFTPTSKKGIPLGLSSLPPVPLDVKEIYDREPETIISMIDSLTGSLVKRLFPETKPEKIENEQKLLYALVEHAWLHDMRLEGLQGLAELIHLVQNPPIKKIGVLPLERYIPRKRREQLAVKLNGLLVGIERLWYEGQPLDIDALVGADQEGNRTQISVINLTEIDSVEDRNFVIAHLGYAIFNWMRRKGGALEPRLLVYIDEIGGGGGKQAIYPSYPFNPSSKPALNLLLRQGRAFGVGCILATQNPGDIDYRGLSNCGTWAIGRLSTKRDRDKVMEGIALAEIGFYGIHDLLAAPQTGEFLIRMRSGEVAFVKERWLMTFHKTVPISELPKLTDLALRARFAEPAHVVAASQPTKPSGPKTPEEVYAACRFGHTVPEPFTVVVEPIGALTNLLEELNTHGIVPEEITVRDLRLRVARIAVADWEIDKVRRDSQGRIRQTITEAGTHVRYAAPTDLGDEEIPRLRRLAHKGISAQWSELAKRVAVDFPDGCRLTKREVQQTVAPRHGIPLNDVRVELQPVLNLGYQYGIEIEYRGVSLHAEIDAVSGAVELALPIFSIDDAIEEVRRQFPDIAKADGWPYEDGMLYTLRAESDDFDYEIAVNKHSCKVVSSSSTITERKARKIAYQHESSEPAFFGQRDDAWIAVYESGRVLRINRSTQQVVEDRHLEREKAIQLGTAKAKELDAEAKLVSAEFIPHLWRLRFGSAVRDIEVAVNRDADVSAMVKPSMDWMQHRLGELFPDGEYANPQPRDSTEGKPRTVYRTYETDVDSARVSCTVVLQPDGEIRLSSKKVKREYVENCAVALLEANGITAPRIVGADYSDDKWHLRFTAPEGKFSVVGDENDCQVLGLVMSKEAAIEKATGWLEERLIPDASVQQSVHQDGVWRFILRADTGEFHLNIDADGCSMVKQELTEEGAMVLAACHVHGEAVAIRKPALGFGKYWVVDVKTEEGIQKVKIDQNGKIG
jgi:hypothetical protein